MSIHMPETIKEERLRWVLPIIHREIRLVDAAKVCPYGRRTLERWVTAYRKRGESGLEPQSTRPKTQPSETPIRIKERIVEIRNKTGLCARTIAWKLEKEGILLHENTIHKIIKREGLTRKYRIKKLTWRYIKVPLKKGELVEIDVKYVPELVGNKQYYQFTAIDCASRWRFLKIYPGYGNAETIDFLETLLCVAPFHVRSIKTDNGSNFTNRYTGYLKSADPVNPRLHEFDTACQKHNIIHYLIDPGKPAQNGKVERSHRTDQERFYDRNQFKTLAELQQKILAWNEEYNNTEHCSLDGKTPNEALQIFT